MKTNFIMQEKVNKITMLIEKFLEEEGTLNEWLVEDKDNRLFFQQITNKETLKEKLKIYSSANSDAIWKKTQRKISGGMLIDLYPKSKIAIRIPSIGIPFIRKSRI